MIDNFAFDYNMRESFKNNNNKRAVLFVWKSRVSKIRHCVTVFTPTYSSAYNYF